MTTHAVLRFIGAALVCGTAAAWSQATSNSGTNVDWPVYRGDPKGNQYSPLAEIHAANVHTLQPAWESGSTRLEWTSGCDRTRPPFVSTTRR